ncbi:MAG: ABC transporter substrate-binding protein [Oscillospiraceae bacterium]|nr:ABC transporter substrate-binding protein [Oscillospiraceae bacterium]
MKKLLSLMLALSMMLALAACGGGGGNGGGGTPPASNPPAGSTGDQTPPPADGGGNGSGGVLRLALSTNDGSTKDDRVPTPWLNHNMATNLMWRCLLLADSSLTKTSPDLAEVTISDDGLTYTITMKDGLKWSDGEPLTADDVLWSIDAVMAATNKNSIYSAAFGKITEKSADGNVITLVLDSPYASMMDILAQFSILPKHSLESADPATIDTADFWKDPVTSGYYMMDEMSVGNYFTLKLNPNYEGTAPKIEKVTVSFVTDFLTAAQAGSADFLYGNASDLVSGMESLSNYQSIPVDVLFYKYFQFNMKGVDGNENEAMQNVEVRKALIKAIDRITLAGFYPTANVLNSGVPNSHEAYNGFEYEYNPEQAKADLVAAGYDMDRTLRICYYNNDQTSIDLINMVVYYLEQAGLKVEATLSNDGTTDLFTTRNYDMGFKGKSSFSMEEWYSEYMSTDALFANIFGGDTAFDDAIAKLASSTNDADKNAALAELQALEQEKVYKVPMFTVGNYVFVSNNVNMPAGVEFCNPLYTCDIDFANWTVA